MREEQIQEAPVKVLLVGVDVGEEPDFERSMEELASLAEAAEKEVAGQMVQRLDHVNKALYIGTGKVTEVRRLAEECGAQEIVFDNSLTPSQVRNLGNELELPIIDRTNLILDIFAIRAQTREAKLQVETARLQYMLPRLVGMYDALSRQGGARRLHRGALGGQVHADFAHPGHGLQRFFNAGDAGRAGHAFDREFVLGERQGGGVHAQAPSGVGSPDVWA